jgi:prepilin-type N-terminal cleavage/methylation domain-containing protein
MSTRTTKSSVGFTIAELLIALAVVSILLTAVAIAFNASVTNYRVNENIFKSISAARQAMHRMTTEIRTAEAVDPNTGSNICSLILADEATLVDYRYQPSEDTLYLDTGGDSYLLCENVTAMTFSKNIETGEYGPYVKSVQISMTVTSGDISQTISAAAVVRRNL